MTGVFVLGAGFGVGVILIVSGLVPARPPLALALERLYRSGTHRPDATLATPRGSVVVRLLGASWAPTGLGVRIRRSAAADLRIVGLTVEEHLAHRVSVAAIALLWAPATAALITAAGLTVPAALTVWISGALAPAGFFLPAIELRARAARRRRSFRHALSSFLDLVSVALAGGKGVEGALTDAAATGDGWPFRELRAALSDARLRGEAPWDGLARLGADLDVPELGELAASAALAGAEGARVKASVAAKAKALRIRVLADVETAAQSASERMSLPIVLLLVGFVLFLGFPAVTQVLQGL
ncbi:MAG: type II secretion system F family protein [Actinomycetota bacterium]|jgi:tight adherence protein C